MTLVNGARRPLPTPAEVAQNTAHWGEEVAGPIRKFHLLMIEDKMTLAQACEYVPHGKDSKAISTSVLSQLLSGTYVSPIGVSHSIQRAVNIISQRKLLAETGFVETRLSQAIFRYCSFSAINQRIVRIYGRTHDGKTTALKAFSKTYKQGQPLYIRLPSSASYLVAAKEFAKAVGYNKPRSNESVREAVFGTITSSHTLLIDEAHLPFTTYAGGHARRVIEFIREIHDQCQCGIVFCGTQTLSDHLMRGDDRILFKQLIQRSPTCLDITQTGDLDLRPGHGKGGKADLVRIAASFLLECPPDDLYETIKTLIATESTGRFFHLLTGASNRAKAKAEPITWDHFRDTLSSLNQFS